MKKLMFAMAAVAAGVAFADDIVSANIVGYTQKDNTGSNWVCLTFPFQTVGSDSEVFTMKDITPDVMESETDTLQVIAPDNARTIATYFQDSGDWYVGDWEDATDDTFDMGSGFLCNFPSGAAKLTDAGQVLAGASSFDFTGKSWVVLGNPLPRPVKFKEIEVVQMESETDTLQKIAPDNARTIETYFQDSGDWYKGDWEDAGDDEIGVGEAFLCNFPSQAVKLNFPSAL